MSGFIPEGWVRAAEYLEGRDLEAVGAALAGGRIKALAMDPWGEIKPIDVSVWRSADARHVLETGLLRARHRSQWVGPDRIVLLPRPRPQRVEPRLTVMDGGNLSDWATSRGAEAEAERRLQAAGVTISEKAKCRALTQIWREAGNTASDDSIERIRRRAREGE